MVSPMVFPLLRYHPVTGCPPLSCTFSSPTFLSCQSRPPAFSDRFSLLHYFPFFSSFLLFPVFLLSSSLYTSLLLPSLLLLLSSTSTPLLLSSLLLLHPSSCLFSTPMVIKQCPHSPKIICKKPPIEVTVCGKMGF